MFTHRFSLALGYSATASCLGLLSTPRSLAYLRLFALSKINQPSYVIHASIVLLLLYLLAIVRRAQRLLMFLDTGTRRRTLSRSSRG